MSKTTAFNVISGFTTPGRRHPVQGPQREGASRRTGSAGRAWPDLPEHPALRAKPRWKTSWSAAQVRRKSPAVDTVFSLPSARREEEEIREGEGPHPPPRARFLHGRKASSLPYRAQRRLKSPAPGDQPGLPAPRRGRRRDEPQESTELMRFIRHIRDEFDLAILLIRRHESGHGRVPVHLGAGIRPAHRRGRSGRHPQQTRGSSRPTSERTSQPLKSSDLTSTTAASMRCRASACASAGPDSHAHRRERRGEKQRHPLHLPAS